MPLGDPAGGELLPGLHHALADEQHRRQVAGHKAATGRELTDAAALHADYGVSIRLLAYSRLRWGEGHALRVRDVDLHRSQECRQGSHPRSRVPR